VSIKGAGRAVKSGNPLQRKRPVLVAPIKLTTCFTGTTDLLIDNHARYPCCPDAEGTKKAHTMAENTGSVSCFLKGVVDKASYRTLVADL